MDNKELEQASAFNAAVWVIRNNFVNENNTPIEFYNHRFLLEPYMDNTPKQVVMKCAQVGWSTLAILRAFHITKYAGANIIYSLPSKNIVRDFVMPKVDPLIEANPEIAKIMGKTDSITLKQIGRNFIYFRSSWEPQAAISISAHILISDEVDRSNPKTLETMQSRLDAAKLERPELGWEWRFSNPSIPNFGVDEWWQKSDQKHWFVKCRYGHEWYLRFPESIDFERGIYICTKCRVEITDEQRRMGRWVNKRKAEISGYWLSQLMCPWKPATEIIEKSKGEQSIFHNFTLGLPYISQDQSVSREALIKCISPDVNPLTDVAMGVDNGVTKTYVLGNRYGIFKVGETKSWEEIENLRNRYNAYMVIDMLPYPNTVKKLIEKYRGKVWGHYFGEDKKEYRMVRWGEGEKWGVVYSDRTRIIDFVVAEIQSQDVTFNMTITEMEQYISDWTQLYRVVEESGKGIMVPQWKTILDRRDHFAFAHILWRIALDKTFAKGDIIRSTPKERNLHVEVAPNKSVPALNLDKIKENLKRGKRDWRTK